MNNKNKTINTVSASVAGVGLLALLFGEFLGDKKLKKAGTTMLTVGTTGLIANNVFNSEDSEERIS
jgi:hypothetical protein